MNFSSKIFSYYYFIRCFDYYFEVPFYVVIICYTKQGYLERIEENKVEIRLTSDQQTIKENKYVTYSYSLKVDIMKVLTKLGRQDEYVFWRSADKKHTFLGISPLLCLEGQNMEEIKNFQDDFCRQYINLTPNIISQPVLLGGFAFDYNGKREQFWQELETGYFILPQILFSKNKEQSYVTLITTTDGDVEQRLNILMNQANDLIVADSATEQQVPAVTIEELEVPKWIDLVNESIGAIKDNKMKKVVLDRQLAVSTQASFNPVLILQRLAKHQPNTYQFLLKGKTRAFVGATPERLLRADNETFKTASVAGSISRGKTPAEDQYLGQVLLNDHKNEAEHQVVVDRITAIMSKFTNNLKVGERQLLKNRDIQHIYHPFSGERKRGVSMLDVLQELHPTPALGGEPREAAMTWLAKKSIRGRGLYGGPVGWLGLGDDQGEFAVGLRSGVFSADKGLLYAGCGIVAESQAEKEKNETRLKFQPMLRGVSDKWIIKKL